MDRRMPPGAPEQSYQNAGSACLLVASRFHQSPLLMDSDVSAMRQNTMTVAGRGADRRATHAGPRRKHPAQQHTGGRNQERRRNDWATPRHRKHDQRCRVPERRRVADESPVNSSAVALDASSGSLRPASTERDNFRLLMASIWRFDDQTKVAGGTMS
jgi:hypothetical protein